MNASLPSKELYHILLAYRRKHSDLYTYISAHARLNIIFNIVKQFSIDTNIDDLTKSLQALDGGNIDVYNIMASEMELIYTTACFDSFLTDFTKLCVISNPNIFLKQSNFSTTTLFSRAVNDIINDSVKQIIIDWSRDGFTERIKKLQTKLGIDFRIDDDEYRALVRWARVRNQMVHEKSFLDIKVDSNLRPLIIIKHLENDDIAKRDDATNLHFNIVAKIIDSSLFLCDPPPTNAEIFHTAIADLRRGFLI